ncbi:hypothetical protein CR969_01680 [Candidatus Saccharibacteria bacterium]|nr:MAG: hypothetical protein CR969_01680 [Candidatus Saccharibacteria bacterium]
MHNRMTKALKTNNQDQAPSPSRPRSVDSYYGDNPPETTKELLDLSKFKILSFQSYSWLVNSGLDELADFKASLCLNPSLIYPKFKEVESLGQDKARLEEAVDIAAGIEPDADKLKVIDATLNFRRAEIGYVELAAEIAKLKQSLEKAEDKQTENILRAKIKEMRELGHELYGEPDSEICDMALNELWSALDKRSYSPSMQKLYDELSSGFWFDEGKYINPMLRAENQEARLPDFEDESVKWLGKHIAEITADMHAIVYEYWDHASATMEEGEKYLCYPVDIVEAIKILVNHYDPENKYGIKVDLVEGRNSISWDTASATVMVGADRDPIESAEELYQKVLHEIGVHMVRFINGSKTDMPLMATGVYTDTKRPDYLTFEEGSATLIEESISEKVSEWDAVKLGHYINISMAEAGADFRSVYEMSWRYRLLMELSDNEEPTEEKIEKHKNLAYKACLRIFRGTQPDLLESTGIDVVPLTFNKDLAYLNGRVIAMQYVKKLYEDDDVEGLRFVFVGKFDPTIPEQYELAKKCVAEITPQAA